MTNTVSVNFRIDTDAMLARFWADLAVVALSQLGQHGAKGADAAKDRLDEIGYFDRPSGEVGEQHKLACRDFENGWDSMSSLFDGRHARQPSAE